MARAVSAIVVLMFACGVAGACRRSSEPEIETPSDPPKKTKKEPVSKKVIREPAKHRVAHVACSKDDTPAPKTTPFKPQPPTPPGPACSSKADCTDAKNGRCSLGHCTYDACYVDQDCKSGVCTCVEQGRKGWYCKQGDCAIDADCPATGYCSPTWSSQCGAFFGVVAWRCHTAQDECVDDTDCRDGGMDGYCAFDDQADHWRCGYGQCEG